MNRIGGKLLKYRMWFIIVILLLCVALQGYLHHSRVLVFCSAGARVIDGDTIVLNGLKIRLQGIDAPESKQSCTNKITGKAWQCGIVATRKLAEIIADKEISCTDEGTDKYQRQLAYCYAGGLNINAEMVRQGYAIAYVQYDVIFLLDELSARWYSRGIWESNFTDPSLWRRQHQKRRI